jgi:hypothetical protein
LEGIDFDRNGYYSSIFLEEVGKTADGVRMFGVPIDSGWICVRELAGGESEGRRAEEE